MERPLRLVRFAYWFGAVFDGAMVVPLLFPDAAAAMLGLEDFHPDSAYRYAAFVGASLMAGWTALLVWGVLDPVARRDVLLLTAFPVVAGLIGSGIYAVASDLVRIGYMLPVFASQVFGVVLFTVAHQRAAASSRGQ